MQKKIIITGINTGLGKAFFDYFNGKDKVRIIAISRRITEEQKRLLKAGTFDYVSIDFSNFTNTDTLQLDKYITKEDFVVFINNAATISPINKIGEFNDNDILNVVSINTVAPLLITNSIMRHEFKELKIINISSGAAHKPIVGWSLYCATKSANEMFFETLQSQENGSNVKVYNINPGVIDSNMQEFIRNTNEVVFPMINDFKALKKNNKLKTPKQAALDVLKEANVE